MRKHYATQVTVTDTNTGEQVTTTLDRVAETIAPWFPEAPAEVGEMLADLQANIDAGRYYGGEEAGLGVEIEYVQN